MTPLYDKGGVTVQTRDGQPSSPRGSHTVVAHRSGQPAHLEGAEERKIGRFTDDKAGTSRQDRSRVVRGRWPVEQPRKKGPPVPSGTPRSRPRRVFTAASCKHTKDKHDPIRGIDHERVAKPRMSRGGLAACIGEEM